MPITQPVTPPSAEPAATSKIPDNYDESGFQDVEEGVFDFDQPESTEPETPFIQDAPGQEDLADFADPVEPETPTDSEKPAVDPEATEVEPVKPVVESEKESPADKTSELKVYAEKFKTVQDLKDSFVQLGGDPAKFGDNVDMLEEAYRVRQTEFSRSRADIAAKNAEPVVPNKTVEELMSEEFGQVNAAEFADPAAMWQATMKGMGNVLNKLQGQQPKPAEQVTPEQMKRNNDMMENLHELQEMAPRIKTDINLERHFASHLVQMRTENRIVLKENGTENLVLAFKDYLKGQSAVLEEHQKMLGKANEAKAVSSAISADNAATNPGNAPAADPDDDIADSIIGAHKADAQKYY